MSPLVREIKDFSAKKGHGGIQKGNAKPPQTSPKKNNPTISIDQ